MPAYQYKARDKSGKLVQGIISAGSQSAVSAQLREQGYIPVSINQAKGQVQGPQFLDRFKRVKFSELNTFTRLLFVLQKAGLPLLSSLRTIRQQTVNVRLQSVIEKIEKDIEAGTELSSAMERHPQIFNALYVSMIKSGEASGTLPEILNRLATLGEHEEDTRLQIKSALRYPFIVVGAIVIAFLVLITIVVPRFEAVYGKYATALPVATQILLGINAAVTKFWWLLIIIAAGVTLLFREIIKTRNGLFWRDNLKLKIPVFGPLLLKLTMSRFCRLTGTLTRSGVPILDILNLVSGAVGNVVISKTINNIRISVNEGKGMSAPMKESGMFPPVVTQMIVAGEETGKMDELLTHVSDYYDTEINYTIKNLISLIEPMLIFVLGIAVLFMALGIFMPMWNMIHVFTAT